MSSEPSKMKPVVILPVGEMVPADIAILRDNGICVVEAKDPSKVRFMEPPPQGYTEAERAAIKLFRIVMRVENRGALWSGKDLGDKYAQVLLNSVDPQPLAQPASVPANPARKPKK